MNLCCFLFRVLNFQLADSILLIWFGLCTWDAFYTNLTMGRLKEILKLFTNVMHFCQY